MPYTIVANTEFRSCSEQILRIQKLTINLDINMFAWPMRITIYFDLSSMALRNTSIEMNNNNNNKNNISFKINYKTIKLH